MDPYLATPLEDGQDPSGGDDEEEWHALEAARQRMWSQSGPALGGWASAASLPLAEGLASLHPTAHGLPQSAEALYAQARARTDELWAREQGSRRVAEPGQKQRQRPPSRVEEEKADGKAESGDGPSQAGRRHSRGGVRAPRRKEPVSRDGARADCAPLHRGHR